MTQAKASRPTTRPTGRPIRSPAPVTRTPCHSTDRRTWPGVNPTERQTANRGRRRRVEVTRAWTRPSAPMRAKKAPRTRGISRASSRVARRPGTLGGLAPDPVAVGQDLVDLVAVGARACR